MTLAIVTGSSAGLGFEVAKQLASHQLSQIVVTSRTLENASRAAFRLKELAPFVEYVPMKLDLSDLNHVRDFAASVKSRFESWDLLVNNAGAKIEHPTKLTAQGHEWHFGVNHLGHYALTLDLLEARTENARVTSVSSIVARKGRSELWGNSVSASTAEQYDASKLANLCFAMELNKKVTGLNSNAAHPGFARAEPYGNSLIRLSEYLLAQSAAQGAKSITEAAINKEHRFSYFAPRWLELWGAPREIEVPDVAAAEAGAYLWKLSEDLTGLQL